LIALLEGESLRQPVVLFIDDVQFIDTDTITFLKQLKRSVLAGEESYPIAIILTLRKQGENIQFVDDLQDREITLVGMARSAIERIVENILGGPASQDLMGLILIHSEGNPFFAEQVVHYLVEEGQLKNSEGGWEKVESVQDSILPGDIRALLVARLDRLTREVKSTVQTASVLGREFDIGVLSQMLGPGVATRDRVNDAEKAAVWSPLNEILYIFHHGLLRDAAYSMQMHARRQELHILALNALEDLYEDELDKHFAELAYHAEQGNSRSKAQRYYALAGKASGELYQNVEAVEYYTKALALTDLDDLKTQFDLLVERVELYSRMGKRELQANDLDSLDRWAEQLKDNERIAKVLMLRSAYSYFLGSYQESIGYAEKAKNISDEVLSNTEQALYTEVVRNTSLLRMGRLDEAMQRSYVTLERAKTNGSRHVEGRMLNVMGLITLEQKDPSPALGYFSEALKIAREVNFKEIESKSISNLAMAEVSINGNYSLAHRYYEESLKIAREIGDRTGESASLGNLGFSAGLLGDFRASRSYHERSLVLARETGNRLQETYTLINLSSLAVLQKDTVAALQQAQLALKLSQATSDPSAEAWALLYLGYAYLLENRYDFAKESFYKSVEIRNDLDQLSLSMEPLAGLVETYMLEDDLTSAGLEAEKIAKYVVDTNSPLEGADEPLRVYYTCYRYLDRQRDQRAGQVLQTAKKLLDTQVSKFKDESDRKRYVNNIPWRKAIRAETEKKL
jgi:predicted ATPase